MRPEPYIPSMLPLPSLDWVELVPLIGQANRAVARFDGILQGMVAPMVLLAPLATQEAVLSSRIEGTQATLLDVLEFDVSPSADNERYLDIQEVVNYRRAMATAVESLKKRPICLSLLRDIHAILLDGVRGQNKRPGEFRRLQNYIGRAGAGIEQASFIPPSPELLLDYLSNFEKYIHFEEKDALVQLAIVHAQFEILHPFLDGNGRVGRMLVPLFLFEKKLLSSPVFYISAYLERNREEYYTRLRGISDSGDWTGWIVFFLDAVIKQAQDNSSRAQAILALYNQLKEVTARLTRSPHAILALDTLFSTPITSSTEFIQQSGIPRTSGLRIIEVLKNADILVELRKGVGRQPAIYGLKALLDVIE
jgi:cell filamentation protein, protein adenylyltransferase